MEGSTKGEERTKRYCNERPFRWMPRGYVGEVAVGTVHKTGEHVDDRCRNLLIPRFLKQCDEAILSKTTYSCAIRTGS